MMEVALVTSMVGADTPPKTTEASLEKFVPRMVTVSPPAVDPKTGSIAVMVGGGCTVGVGGCCFITWKGHSAL